MRWMVVPLLMLSLANAQDARATLESGDELQGSVAGLYAEGVAMLVEGSERFIPWVDLKAPGLRVTSDVAVMFGNGDRVTARVLRLEDDALVIAATFIPEGRIPTAALPPRPAPTPERPAQEAAETSAEEAAKPILDPADWNGSVALLGTFRKGNTDSGLFQLNATLKRQWTSDRLKLYGSVAYGKTEGEHTAGSIMAGGKWDHFYHEDFYSYTRSEFEYDKIKNLDLRVTSGIGAGVNLWRGDKDHQSFDLEAGVDYLHQSYDSETPRNDASGRGAFVYKNRLFGSWLLSEEFEIIFPFVDPSDFIISSTTKLQTALSKRWNLQNTFEVEYSGKPADDTTALDLRLLVGLEYKF